MLGQNYYEVDGLGSTTIEREEKLPEVRQVSRRRQVVLVRCRYPDWRSSSGTSERFKEERQVLEENEPRTGFPRGTEAPPKVIV